MEIFGRQICQGACFFANIWPCVEAIVAETHARYYDYESREETGWYMMKLMNNTTIWVCYYLCWTNNTLGIFIILLLLALTIIIVWYKLFYNKTSLCSVGSPAWVYGQPGMAARTSQTADIYSKIVGNQGKIRYMC